MKKIVLLAVFALVFTLPATTLAQYWTGNANLFIGGKMLDKDDWEPLEEHVEFGFLLDFGKTDWPVNIAIDFLGSQDSDSFEEYEYDYYYFYDYKVTTTEINVGIRKSFGEVIRPYFGGGLAMITAKEEFTLQGLTYSEDDTGLGYWINGGVYLTIGDALNLGLDVRYSAAKATLFNYDAEAGGVHVGFVVGYHW
jgi:opacity protein-like surface antigen